MIRIHLHDTSSTKEVSIICKRRTRLLGMQDWEERYVNRSWSPFINTLQTEDRSGYGTQVRPVPQLRCSTVGNTQTPTMMTWILFGILTGCPELWTSQNQHFATMPGRDGRWQMFITTASNLILSKWTPGLRSKRYLSLLLQRVPIMILEQPRMREWIFPVQSQMHQLSVSGQLDPLHQKPGHIVHNGKCGKFSTVVWEQEGYNCGREQSTCA